MTGTARPSFWAEPLLRALLPPHRVDDVTGDLLETYRQACPILPTRPTCPARPTQCL